RSRSERDRLCCTFLNRQRTRVLSTLSLHDALPISSRQAASTCKRPTSRPCRLPAPFTCRQQSSAGVTDSTCCSSRSHSSRHQSRDRKSTRLNSSHVKISYAVFCLKKKKRKKVETVA